MLLRSWVPLIALLWASATAVASIPALSVSERSSLRYRLENLFNEADLSIRNYRSDRLDLERQNEIARYLKIYERIPLEPRLEEIRVQLRNDAEENHLKIRNFRFLPRPHVALPKIPAEMFTDERPLRLTAEQITERLPFRFVVRGERNRVRAWVRGWTANMMRILEAEGGIRSPNLEPLGSNEWEIEAWGFRFREIHFPRLKLRNPRDLLPPWARDNPGSFARQEPTLWSLVGKTEKIAPKAAAGLRVRERFLFNDARISVYSLKTSAPR